MYKETGLTDKNGKAIMNGKRLKFTAHKGYMMESDIFTVCWDNKRACFGYKREVTMYPNRINPFSQHHELREDILNHCEIIE
jgi:hypothetical protein